MANRKPKTVLFRRKRQQKTNYAKRMKLLLSTKPRLVVRITNQKIIAQVIDYHDGGDVIIAAGDSFSLKKLDWKFSCSNFPAAYLTGLMVGKKAVSKGVTELILDTGFQSALKGGKIFATLKGAIDAGLKIPHDENVLPTKEHIEGQHIAKYAGSTPGKQQFAKYLKNNLAVSDIATAFEDTKKKIMG